MNENIDLTKILKDCPVGTEFYHVVYGRVWLTGVFSDDDCPIRLSLHNGPYTNTTLTKKGTFSKNYGGECLLFPSREQRDWSKFKPKKERFDPNTLKPFDRVLVRDYHDDKWICSIFSHIEPGDSFYYVCINYSNWKYCIPYTEDTKHLINKNEEAPEFYRYWED